MKLLLFLYFIANIYLCIAIKKKNLNINIIKGYLPTNTIHCYRNFSTNINETKELFSGICLHSCINKNKDTGTIIYNNTLINDHIPYNLNKSLIIKCECFNIKKCLYKFKKMNKNICKNIINISLLEKYKKIIKQYKILNIFKKPLIKIIKSYKKYIPKYIEKNNISLYNFTKKNLNIVNLKVL